MDLTGFVASRHLAGRDRPFTRPAPETDGARSKGLGLGLYIASEIVHAHGATISVTSTASQGTTFTIRWPRSVPRRSAPLHDEPACAGEHRALLAGCPEFASER